MYAYWSDFECRRVCQGCLSHSGHLQALRVTLIILPDNGKTLEARWEAYGRVVGTVTTDPPAIHSESKPLHLYLSRQRSVIYTLQCPSINVNTTPVHLRLEGRHDCSPLGSLGLCMYLCLCLGQGALALGPLDTALWVVSREHTRERIGTYAYALPVGTD